MDKATEHLRKIGKLPDPSLREHVSPLGWEHVNLTGDYVWDSGAAERPNERPSDTGAARKWVYTIKFADYGPLTYLSEQTLR